MSDAACPLCGHGKTVEAIGSAPDHITNDPFSIRTCPSCAVAFTFPFPASLDRYYPSQYRGYSALTKAVLRVLYRFRVWSWVRRIRTPGTALEVGCGPGMMLNELKRRGWKTMGLERTEAMAAYAREELGLDVRTCGVEDLPRGRDYDLIVLFQVLEHMRDPLLVLKECATRLKPGGTLIVNVPNFASWQARSGSRDWLHLDPPRHLVHFTPQSLGWAFQNAGLRVENTGFVSWEHDPFGWVQTVINRFVRPPQRLTRYLMGLEGLNPGVIVSVVLAAVLAIPALILSVVSWTFACGALMQMTGTVADSWSQRRSRTCRSISAPCSRT